MFGIMVIGTRPVIILALRGKLFGLTGVCRPKQTPVKAKMTFTNIHHPQTKTRLPAKAGST
ncbi:hypothetical protein [Exiguobacterium sp. s141]|uniref:hypothetical protein n=1 Tax=Exiguobacterium TaxID=33986 RepID=UPI001BEA76F4|nr:hypothetical protein [Exiguobacterium sp. s141]